MVAQFLYLLLPLFVAAASAQPTAHLETGRRVAAAGRRQALVLLIYGFLNFPLITVNPPISTRGRFYFAYLGLATHALEECRFTHSVVHSHSLCDGRRADGAPSSSLSVCHVDVDLVCDYDLCVARAAQ